MKSAKVKAAEKEERAEAKAAEKAEQAEIKEAEAKAAAKPKYNVIVNGGSRFDDSIADLTELADIANTVLVENKARDVTMRIDPLFEKGEFAAQRCDGVK